MCFLPSVTFGTNNLPARCFPAVRASRLLPSATVRLARFGRHSDPVVDEPSCVSAQVVTSSSTRGDWRPSLSARFRPHRALRREPDVPDGAGNCGENRIQSTLITSDSARSTRAAATNLRSEQAVRRTRTTTDPWQRSGLRNCECSVAVARRVSIPQLPVRLRSLAPISSKPCSLRRASVSQQPMRKVGLDSLLLALIGWTGDSLYLAGPTRLSSRRCPQFGFLRLLDFHFSPHPLALRPGGSVLVGRICPGRLIYEP